MAHVINVVERILVFDNEDRFVALLDNKKLDALVFWDAVSMEQVNGENRLDFSCSGEHPDSQFIVEGNLVIAEGVDKQQQLYEIKIVDEIHGVELEKVVSCENSAFEMLDEHIEEIEMNDNALNILHQVLDGSRWDAGNVISTSSRLYRSVRESRLSAVHRILGVHGGELRFRIRLGNNEIQDRFVDIVDRRGSDSGKRFEYGKDVEFVRRTIDMTGVFTAMYGYGKGSESENENEEIEVERLDFADVEWSIAEGDPADKPLGQKYVADVDALGVWGRAGGTRHRFGVHDASNVTTEEGLLNSTWRALQRANEPSIVYAVNVVDLEKSAGFLHERIRLGDDVIVIDSSFEPELEVKARILEIKHDILQPENTRVVLGNFMPLITDDAKRLREIENFVNNRSGVWDDKFDELTTVPTSLLDGEIDILQNNLFNTQAFLFIEDDGIIIYDAPTKEEATQAMRLAGGIFGLANEKINGEFDYRSFGTGDGFTADEMITGRLRTDQVVIGSRENEDDPDTLYFFWDVFSLTIIDPANFNKQIRIGRYDPPHYGIAFTDDNGLTWTTAITHDGINADAITVGELDAEVINVVGDANFRWDGSNIVITDPNNADDQIRIGQYDGVHYGIAFTDDGGSTWNTVMDWDGVVLDSGNFRLRDEESGIESIVRENINFINDHSFEGIPRGQTLSPPGNNYSAWQIDMDKMSMLRSSFGWWFEGDNPRIVTTVNTGFPRLAFADYQCAIVDFGSRPEQYIELDSEVMFDGPYTFSAYVSSHEGTEIDTEIIMRVDAIKSGEIGQDDIVLGTVGMTSIVVKVNEKYRWRRMAIMNIVNLDSETDFLRVRFTRGAGNEGLVDAVQAVPFNFPVVYNSESSVWKLIQGLAGFGFAFRSIRCFEDVVALSYRTDGALVGRGAELSNDGIRVDAIGAGEDLDVAIFRNQSTAGGSRCRAIWTSDEFNPNIGFYITHNTSNNSSSLINRASSSLFFGTGNRFDIQIRGSGNVVIGQTSAGVEYGLDVERKDMRFAPDVGHDSAFLINNSGTTGAGSNATLRPDIGNRGFIGTPFFNFWAIYAVNIHASTFHNSSSREGKIDIKSKSDDDSYNLIKGLKVYQYKVKKEIEQAGDDIREHIGLMSEECPDIITDSNKASIDLYGLVSSLVGSVKKLQTMVDDMDGRIKEIERRVL